MIDLPSSISWMPLTLPDTHVGELRSSSNGTTYQISLWHPESAPPTGGFPVIYVLDSGTIFASFAETLRRACRRPESTGIGPAVLVGIDHASMQGSPQWRDYTAGPCANEPAGDVSVGGAGAFLDFLDKELIPVIEGACSINPFQRTLFGHSLAGYFCLWTLVSRPEVFTRHAAISPSIWWDATILHDSLAHCRISAPSRRVYLAVGEWEGLPAPWQHALAANPMALERRNLRRMIENARRFSEGLRQSLPVESVRFDLLHNEDHSSVLGPATSRALRFLVPASDLERTTA